MLGDGVMAVVVFLLVSIIRFGNTGWTGIWTRLGIDIGWAAVAFGIGWVVALWYHGLYRLRARWQLRTEAKDIARSTVLVAAISLAILFVFKQQDVSRLFLLTLFTVQPLVTFTSRGVLRLAFSEIRRRGHNARYMLVVGTGQAGPGLRRPGGGAAPAWACTSSATSRCPGRDSRSSRARSWGR